MADTREKNRTEPPRKFLFDSNCFDEGYQEEIIPEVPPPPTYSEEELAKAKAESFAQGKRTGNNETLASIEKQVAALLEVAGRNIKALLEAEDARAAKYEAEAVALADAVFKKLFPAVNERYGLAEIEEVMIRVLESHQARKEIVLEIHPDYVEPVRARLAMIADATRNEGQITITGNTELGRSDCRMYWNDGGAERNATRLAQEIHSLLEHMLAGKAVLHDNEETGDASGDEP